MTSARLLAVASAGCLLIGYAVGVCAGYEAGWEDAKHASWAAMHRLEAQVNSGEWSR